MTSPGPALSGIPSGGFIQDLARQEAGLSPSPSHHLGARMEDLIELVAASFARYGIECPRDDRKVVERASSPVPADPTALPEHNFRKGLQPDSAP